MDERIPAYIITALDYQYNRLNELDMLIDGIEKQLISIVRQS
ncbi:tnpA [Shigella flexneri K-227]|uniref:TnpA n=2 Tax=Shigella TaxID=620 RepID=F5P4J1_SHIFL|nr:tnpA [Shigella flexneri K-227]EGK31276.1 tnpA [Shigella flexneri K-227]EJL18817.1 tnpA [Shigella sonnei str. Moseley]ESU76014.1 Transposase [Shigella dysenteriae WRSd3]ESU76693.1 Transposase [Shigella dysenteriae WRSd5]